MHVLCQLCYYIVFEKQPNGAGWTGGNVRVHGHGRLTQGIHMEVAPAHPLPSLRLIRGLARYPAPYFVQMTRQARK